MKKIKVLLKGHKSRKILKKAMLKGKLPTDSKTLYKNMEEAGLTV